jgi:hypothetical protein
MATSLPAWEFHINPKLRNDRLSNILLAQYMDIVTDTTNAEYSFTRISKPGTKFPNRAKGMLTMIRDTKRRKKCPSSRQPARSRGSSGEINNFANKVRFVGLELFNSIYPRDLIFHLIKKRYCFNY